jgi:hypothetical protein
MHRADMRSIIALCASRAGAQNVMKLGHNKRAQLDMPEEEKPPVTWV